MNRQFFRLVVLIMTSTCMLFSSCRKDKMTDKPDDILDEHKSKVKLPKGSDLTINDITLYEAGGTEIDKSKNGGFTTSANSLIAVNNNDDIVYLCYLSTDTVTTDKKVVLNSEETAVSLLLQVFPNVFDVAPVEKFQILKKLIRELPETQVLSESIDKSIVKNGYLEFNDVEQEYKSAVDKIVELTGLKDNFLSSNIAKKQRKLKSAKYLKSPKLPYNSVNGIRLEIIDSKYIKDEAVWRCKLTGYCDRFSYIAFVHGRMAEDGSAYPSVTSFSEQMKYLAPPMNVSAFMDKTSSWSGIKDYFSDTWKLMTEKDFGFADMTWDMTKVDDIYMDFKTKEDVVIAYAPADNKNVFIYNTVIAIFSPVLSLISENAGNNEKSFVKKFVKEFCAELITDDMFMKSLFYIADDNNLTAKNKIVKIYNLLRPKFIDFVTGSAIELFPEIAKSMANKALKKALTDVNFYTKEISITGDVIFSYLGYTQKSLAFPVELSFPENLSLSKNQVEVKEEEFVTITITTGNGKYTTSSDNIAVATVSMNGNNLKIKGIAKGSATVTVTDVETGETKTIAITVTAAIPDLALAQSEIGLQEGKNVTVAVTAGSSIYTVSSDDTNIATASIDGNNVKITGVAAGNAVITVSDTKTKQTKNIAVTVKANLALAQSEISLQAGKNATVAVTAGSGKYTVSSDDTDIATASVDGNNVKINGIAEGTATVTVTDTETSKTKTIAVTVTAATPDLALANSTASVQAGKNATVAITAGSGKYTVSSDDTDIATASINGNNVKINAIAAGNAIITVKDTESEQEKTIAVTVTTATTPDLALAQNTASVQVGNYTTVAIKAGSGTYTASIDNPGIATASIAGNNVKINGVAAGSATVTVTDTETSKTKIIAVTVTAATPNLALANSTASVQVGSHTTVAITAGSGTYTASSDNTGIATASINGNNVKINGVAEGTATVTVTDIETSKTKTIDVTVTAASANGTFTDPRDNTTYKTVKIGNQIWMAENLKYLPSVVGPGTGSDAEALYYVYGYNGTDVAAAKQEANYQTYGVLYNWLAAMNGEAGSNANPSGVQGVCPAGWHLPSDAEWTELTDYLGGASVAGGKLKETGTTHWESPNIGATNESGFNALPGGYRYDNDGSFDDVGKYGYWWGSTPNGSEYAWRRLLYYLYGGVHRYDSSHSDGFSVRCLKD